MNASRLWTIGSIVVIIAVVAGTWFVGISPRLTEAATANSERASIEFLNQQHAATVASLKKQFEELPDLNTQLEQLRTAVPAGDDSAALLRQLHALARSAGITVTDLTLSAPERFALPAEPPAEAELAAALGSVGPENFLVIPVEQTVTGEHAQIMAYLDGLQKGERAFLVHDVTFDSGIPSNSTQVSVTFSGQVFVLLDGVAASEPAPEGGAVPTEGTGIPQ